MPERRPHGRVAGRQSGTLEQLPDPVVGDSHARSAAAGQAEIEEAAQHGGPDVLPRLREKIFEAGPRPAPPNRRCPG